MPKSNFYVFPYRGGAEVFYLFAMGQATTHILMRITSALGKLAVNEYHLLLFAGIQKTIISVTHFNLGKNAPIVAN